MSCETILLTDGWSFLLTPPETETLPEGENESFLPVRVPHDWLIGDTTGLYRDGCGWYRRVLSFGEKEIDPECDRVLLRFDGVYMDTTVYLNGSRAGDWKYGYTSFDMDITKYLRAGENELLVQVRFRAPNSRWYTGAGIYRRVWLRICRGAHLVWDGTYVHTEKDGENFRMQIRTETAAVDPAGLRCRYSLWKDGVRTALPGSAAVSKMPFGGMADICAGEQEAEGEKVPFHVFDCSYEAKVCTPALWSPEEPGCYELLVELVDDEGAVLDESRISIGFRTIEFDPDHGLFLNGRNLKVHGVCEHHDLGCLGAAFYRSAMERKLRILKGMGVNAIRTGHNPPDPEVMLLADRMGFLVIDEAFDMWEKAKNPYDYARFFPEWAQRDVRSWIRRDRNHPSLLLWSIGNEIYDTHAGERGQELTRMLSDYVRRDDPLGNARITLGSNYMPWENAQKCADILKIAGYNYGEKYYREHHEKYPDWVIYGSETSSIVQSRGIYHFPLSQSILADEDEQCSALGNSATSWGAKSIETCITGDRDAEFSFGQFLWSGFDYIGEPTPYHTKNSYFGQIDTAGFPKDSYYIFRAEWGAQDQEPFVHLFPYWDFNEGQLVDVRACTNLPYVELFVNGVSHGRQKIDHVHGQKLLGDWQVAYEPGMIEAVGYTDSGQEAARTCRRSFGESRYFRLTPDKELLDLGAGDLCFVTIETLDAQGNPVENAADCCRIEVTGAGRLLGTDNGDSTDTDSYQSGVRRLFSGKLLAVIEPEEAGLITVCVYGNRIKAEALELRVTDSSRNERTGTQSGPADREGGSAGTQRDWTGDGAEDCRVCAGADAKKPGQPGHGRAVGPDSPLPVPVRKIELRTEGPGLITPESPQLLVEAQILPGDADDTELIWKVVTDSGIEVNFASIKAVPADEGLCQAEAAEANRCTYRTGAAETNGKSRYSAEAVSASRRTLQRAIVTAVGDGSFRIRCMSKSGTGKVRLISQLECEARGFGEAYLNPYEGVSAGLYSAAIGEIGNGNEKGIATARDGRSGVVYERVNFGSYGSDEITLAIFALDALPYPIEIWLGNPEDAKAPGNESSLPDVSDGAVASSGESEGEENEPNTAEVAGSAETARGRCRLLDTVIYQKPSRWNVYQPETYRLPERICGVVTLSFVLNAKVHIRDFSFSYKEKAFQKLYAAEADSVYGDSFAYSGRAVTEIGNNVTFVYEDMDFGTAGTDCVTVTGRTGLDVNSIHLRFTPEDGDTILRILEFAKTECPLGSFTARQFVIEPFTGRGRIELIFLPGSSFDLESVEFARTDAEAAGGDSLLSRI